MENAFNDRHIWNSVIEVFSVIWKLNDVVIRRVKCISIAYLEAEEAPDPIKDSQVIYKLHSFPRLVLNLKSLLSPFAQEM